MPIQKATEKKEEEKVLRTASCSKLLYTIVTFS